MTRIKLCGLTRPADIAVANRLRPDYVGFVFAPGSRRYLSPADAAALRPLLAPPIAAVGVFVRQPPELVADLLRRGIIDLAQLHGGEDVDYLRRLRALTDRPLIQAVAVRGPADLDAAAHSLADLLLLDAGPGGTGTAFDWSLLTGFQRPYLLAGGLTPDNVAPAIARLHPYGVDVSSGIETDGRKDPNKMSAFVRAVRKEDL